MKIYEDKHTTTLKYVPKAFIYYKHTQKNLIETTVKHGSKIKCQELIIYTERYII